MTARAEKEPEVENWSWRRVTADARQRLIDKGYPLLPQPKSSLDELGYVEDVEALSGPALANMTVRHQAWYAYLTTQLAVVSAELTALEEILEVLLGERMHEIGQTMDKREVKDVLKALAIQRDDVIKGWFRRKMELVQDSVLLGGTVKGLEIRCRGLESEQIRRATVLKVEGGR